MNNEIEKRLKDKADNWELRNVQNENRELKNQIHELERKIENLEVTVSNRYYVIERFLNMLAEQPQFADMSDQIYELRGSL